MFNPVCIEYLSESFDLKEEQASEEVNLLGAGGDASPMAFGTDYIVNYTTYTITFTVAPGIGTDNVDIEYDFGSTDKIYGDVPQTTISVSSYPRIAVQITSETSEEGAVDGSVIITDYLISIYTYTSSIDELEDYVKSTREYLLNNRKGFYYTRYLSPAGKGPTFPEPERGNKIVSKTQEWRAPLNFEVIS